MYKSRLVATTLPSCSWIFALFALLCCATGWSAESARFAVPVEPTALSSSSATLKTLLSLILIVTLLLGCAWLMRRFGMTRHARTRRLQIIDQLSLGTRERAVLIRVSDQEILLGIAPGSVRTLLVVPADALPEALPDGEPGLPDNSNNPTSFKQILRRSLGL
jgi:flagellar protein FliO/FliZ